MKLFATLFRLFALLSLLVMLAGSDQPSDRYLAQDLERRDAEVKVRRTIEECEKLALINPQSPEAQYNLGAAYSLRWYQKSQATAAFSAAIRLRPEYSQSYNALGWLALNMNSSYASLVHYADDTEGCRNAIGFFKTALQFDRNFSEAYLGLGLALHGFGRHIDALNAYEQAVRLKPDGPFAYGALSALYEDLGRYDDAIKAREQGVREELNGETDSSKSMTFGLPSLPRAYDAFMDRIKLGDLYLKLGRYEAAADYYRRGIEVEPHDATGYHRLGIAYFLLGDRASALTQYSALVDLARTPPRKLPQFIDTGYQHFADDLLYRIER